MENLDAIKEVINSKITANGNGEITGSVLNQTLIGIVDAVAESVQKLTDDVIDNEEVTAAALNDLNDNKVSHADMESAIAEAISASVTTTLNTAI